MQEKDLRDITDEIRKLKAIIVKHENRIRALEAAVRAQEGDDTDSRPAAAPVTAGNGNSSSKAATDGGAQKESNDNSSANDQSHSTAANDDEF